MNVFIADIQDSQAFLNAEESWHCCKVLRHKAGDTIGIINGKGMHYEARLELVNEKACRARLTGQGRAEPKRPCYLHMAVAPTKQIDRSEWMLEKMVEIGIDEISFMQCKNSERLKINPERMSRISESAVKQSQRATIPLLHGMRDFKNLCAEQDYTLKLIAHCEPGIKVDLRELSFNHQKILCLIGPEGDFSPDEVDFALKQGFKPVTLGPHRLRTETAALYLCQAAALLS
ncbi:MAG TPA: RsmE family RNA methyltransferase [Bacteroidia bacterium]|nr:RsmE family RNA methyltransferase [Bacteroidia bacterium]